MHKASLKNLKVISKHRNHHLGVWGLCCVTRKFFSIFIKGVVFMVIGFYNLLHRKNELINWVDCDKNKLVINYCITSLTNLALLMLLLQFYIAISASLIPTKHTCMIFNFTSTRSLMNCCSWWWNKQWI